MMLFPLKTNGNSDFSNNFKLNHMKFKSLVFLLIFSSVLVSKSGNAQSPEHKAPAAAPIPVEIFLGTNGWTSQVVIDKKFMGSEKLGMFALTYLRANYDNDAFLQESTNIALLKYDVFKNVSVLSGALMNNHWGFRPYAGAQYGYHSRTFMGLLNSGFHLTGTKNFETIAMLEYRPALKGAWSLYTRAQGMYSLKTVDGNHDRSSLYGRLGLSYKAYSFGFAVNHDAYGSGVMSISDNQFGIFISTIL